MCRSVIGLDISITFVNHELWSRFYCPFRHWVRSLPATTTTTLLILFTMCLVFVLFCFLFAPNYFCNKKSTVGIASRARPGPISSKTKGMRARDRRLVAARLTPLFLPKKLLAFLPQPCEIHVFPRSTINATPLTVSYYLTKPYFTYCCINAKNMELIKLDF